MANPESLSPDNERSMDLTVSCDIRLGRLFHTTLELQGKYLDINMSAIETIVDSFDPETTQPLSFEAVLDVTLAKELDQLGGHDKIIAGGLSTLTESTDKQRLSRVIIGVGGPLTALAYYPASLVTKALEEVPRLANKSKRSKSSSLADEDKLALLRFLRDSSSLVPSESLQETVVHELRHAADFTRPSLEKRSERYNRMTQIKSVLGIIGVYAAAEVASQIPFDIAHIGENSLLRIGAVIAAAAVVMGKAEKYIDRYRLKRELRSPHERLAYATAEIASSYPTVISFKDLPTDSEQ